MNTSAANVVLTAARLATMDVEGESQGVSFDFSHSPVTTLSPGQRILVVEDRAAFEFRYGRDLPVVGEWNGGLSNQSELLTLLSYRGDVIQQFTYRDSDDWPGRADGTGSSLEIINTTGNYNDADNWQPSVDFRRLAGPSRIDSPAGCHQ